MDMHGRQIRFPDNLPDRIRAAVDTIKEGLVERDTEVRLMLLATLCGEHLLLLGPPGTAKSELSRRLAQLSSGYYFERLLTRFSVPEELFGPLSLAGLERDVYERQLKGYLPTVRSRPSPPPLSLPSLPLLGLYPHRCCYMQCLGCRLTRRSIRNPHPHDSNRRRRRRRRRRPYC